MWISRRFFNNSVPTAEIGTITQSKSFEPAASATSRSNNISIYAPYGYSFCAPKGEQLLLVSSALGAVGSGTKMKNNTLEAGEIEISSLGGAKIVLKNNGDVVINGVAIPRGAKQVGEAIK